MRNPLIKALWSLGLAMLGVVLLLIAYVFDVEIGEATTTVLAITGLAAAVVFAFTFLWAVLSAIGYARLNSGKGLIAKWHLTASEWDRFRAFNDIRAAQHSSLKNDMHIRNQTPLQGVDVIVGSHSIIVDGSYHSLAGSGSQGRHVNWINAPVDPECIEFPKSYSRSHGGSLDLTLRVPVPASARPEGVRVYEHYRSKGEK